jgi:hypothetical protein
MLTGNEKSDIIVSHQLKCRNDEVFNPDISQEFCFGRPFCPAAAFSVKNVLSVFSNTPPGLFDLRPCIGPKFLAQNSLYYDKRIILLVRLGWNGSYDDSVKTL